MDWISNNRLVLWLSLTLLYCLSANAQTINGSFSHDGATRQYSIYLPANYATVAPCPVVFNLHGYGSNRSQQASLSQMNAIADTAGFIVVYPDGLPDGLGQQGWNSGYATGVDDVGFIDRLLDTVLTRYSAQPTQVYSMGLSNGAIMSHTLACELGQRFAAIGSVAGTMSWLQYNNCGSAAPMPVIHIHGTSDIVVPYNGNTALVGVPTLIAHWRTRNGLSSTATSTYSYPNTSLTDNSTASGAYYSTGSPAWIQQIDVANGGHSWPGSGVFISGSTNMDFSASIEIWRFFRRFDRTLSTAQAVQATTWSSYLATGTRTLHWAGERPDAFRLTVYNAMGQLVLDQVEGKDYCSLAHLPSGYYVAHWRSGQEQHSQPIVLP